MTPFQQAVSQHQQGTLNTPDVSYEGRKVDYFGYQLATHKYALSIMAAGMKMRGLKLADIKHYYGLKGKTAADCLPQFIALMEEYKSQL
jgi:hypothetical protein